MSRRNNSALRCSRCRMHGSLCVCALIPRLETRTRVVLLIHRLEDRKTTNAGRLATECLTNSEVVVRGHTLPKAAPLTRQHGAGQDLWSPGSRPLFLFPHEGAIPLAHFAGSPEPLTLLVPDGTWRQASKVRNRVAGLRDVPCVSIPHDAPSLYRLRSEAHDGGLATLEAIARAMGILEGAHVRSALELVFRAMVDRTLWARGEIASEAVTGGIPPGTMRHDPRPLASK